MLDYRSIALRALYALERMTKPQLVEFVDDRGDAIAVNPAHVVSVSCELDTTLIETVNGLHTVASSYGEAITRLAK